MNYNPFSLEGKRILVTGASSGIGRCIALECIKMGANIVISGRNPLKLHETSEMCSDVRGDNVPAIVSDISVQEGIDKLVSECPMIDGFVNSAGILEFATTKSIKLELLSKVVNTNAVAPVMITKGLLKQKKIKGNSSIVYISSLSGVYIGGTGEIAYSFSKGALSGYVKTASLELAPKSIRMNAICPALIPTELSCKYHEIASEEKLKSEIPLKYPIGRIGTVQDVAYAAIFLLSDASSWITGTNIVIDGGLTLK